MYNGVRRCFYAFPPVAGSRIDLCYYLLLPLNILSAREKQIYPSPRQCQQSDKRTRLARACHQPPPDHIHTAPPIATTAHTPTEPARLGKGAMVACNGSQRVRTNSLWRRRSAGYCCALAGARRLHPEVVRRLVHSGATQPDAIATCCRCCALRRSRRRVLRIAVVLSSLQLQS